MSDSSAFDAKADIQYRALTGQKGSLSLETGMPVDETSVGE